MALLGNYDPIVITCDAQNQQFNQQGKLCGWTGLASVITESGIYHALSNDSEFTLPNEGSFLSWNAFFDLCEGIQHREEVPDIWLGTQRSVLIKGTYFDFSQNIAGWIHFYSEQQAELSRLFEQFRATLSVLRQK